MARLHEYQGKAILAANGFKIPRGRAASTADDAVAAFKELAGDAKNQEMVIKIQAWTTGRAGIGGVMFAKRPDEAQIVLVLVLVLILILLFNAEVKIRGRGRERRRERKRDLSALKWFFEREKSMRAKKK